MLAYAVRFEVNEIVLFYPNTINHEEPKESELVIVDELSIDQKVYIKSVQLPIINFEMFKENYQAENTIKLDFKRVKEKLKDRLEMVLGIN
jgi:5-methylcytosine-specific restriction enzyme subunit McrC